MQLCDKHKRWVNLAKTENVEEEAAGLMRELGVEDYAIIQSERVD